MFGERVRELRESRGITLGELAARIPVNKGHLSRVERGERPPTDDLARRIDQVLDARGDLIALAHLDSAAARDAAPWQTADLLRRLRVTDTAPPTLDALRAAVVELCCEYGWRDARALRAEGQEWLREVARLLREPVGLREHRELLVAGGWLALLIGCVEYDLGMRAAAEPTRVAASQLGTEAGHPEIIGWAYEMSAWFSLTQGRYVAVLASTRAGQRPHPGLRRPSSSPGRRRRRSHDSVTSTAYARHSTGDGSYWTRRRTPNDPTTTSSSIRPSGTSTRWTPTGWRAPTSSPATTPARCSSSAPRPTGPSGRRCGWPRRG